MHSFTDYAFGIIPEFSGSSDQFDSLGNFCNFEDQVHTISSDYYQIEVNPDTKIFATSPQCKKS
jgi:hypothetical protein